MQCVVWFEQLLWVLPCLHHFLSCILRIPEMGIFIGEQEIPAILCCSCDLQFDRMQVVKWSVH